MARKQPLHHMGLPCQQTELLHRYDRRDQLPRSTASNQHNTSLMEPKLVMYTAWCFKGEKYEVAARKCLPAVQVTGLHRGWCPAGPGQRISAYATRSIRNTRIIRNTQGPNCVLGNYADH
jgi:hypothetical protein